VKNNLSQNCSKCGLPLEICACKAIGKETTQQIKVFCTKKRFNKLVTIVEGLGEDAKETAKQLKHKLACGGSSKDGVVILQGAHKQKTVEYLQQLGYPREIIKVI